MKVNTIVSDLPAVGETSLRGDESLTAGFLDGTSKMKRGGDTLRISGFSALITEGTADRDVSHRQQALCPCSILTKRLVCLEQRLDVFDRRVGLDVVGRAENKPSAGAKRLETVAHFVSYIVGCAEWQRPLDRD